MSTAISSATSSTSTTTTTSASANAGTTQKNEFLKLLTYQLKSQNPLKPYDNQEFASQLAQFSQLEQLVDIKSLLDDASSANSTLNQTMANSALPGMLGKTAKVESSSLTYDGTSAIKLGYTAENTASSGELTIYDDSGNIVKTVKLTGSQLYQGDNTIKIDPVDDNGNALPQGKYKFAVKLSDAKGSSTAADTFIYGKVESVRFKSEGTVLVVNGTETALGKVIDISTD